jgi:hypothetical protein
MTKPWDKPHPMARKCQYCGSQKPGMQPLTIVIDDRPVRGYWHLKCFNKAKAKLKTIPQGEH